MRERFRICVLNVEGVTGLLCAILALSGLDAASADTLGERAQEQFATVLSSVLTQPGSERISVVVAQFEPHAFSSGLSTLFRASKRRTGDGQGRSDLTTAVAADLLSRHNLVAFSVSRTLWGPEAAPLVYVLAPSANVELVQEEHASSLQFEVTPQFRERRVWLLALSPGRRHLVGARQSNSWLSRMFELKKLHDSNWREITDGTAAFAIDIAASAPPAVREEPEVARMRAMLAQQQPASVQPVLESKVIEDLIVLKRATDLARTGTQPFDQARLMGEMQTASCRALVEVLATKFNVKQSP